MNVNIIIELGAIRFVRHIIRGNEESSSECGSMRIDKYINVVCVCVCVRHCSWDDSFHLSSQRTYFYGHSIREHTTGGWEKQIIIILLFKRIQ